MRRGSTASRFLMHGCQKKGHAPSGEKQGEAQ